jgi:putative endonuclease
MSSTQAERRALGDYGERLAAAHLVAKGFVILDRNWRCSAGEIDVVAADGDTLVVCEVKTRSGSGFGTPLEAITPAKAGRLHRLGWMWVKHHHVRCAGLRVDVVAIVRASGGGFTVDHIVGVA